MTLDGLLIAVRFALYISIGGLFGLAAFAVYGLRGDGGVTANTLRGWLAGLTLASLLSSIIALELLASAMAGVPAWPVDHAAVALLATMPGMGTAWIVRMAALVIVLLASITGGRVGAARLAAGSALVAAATLAWTGHGAMADGTGWGHLAADILHLLAAGAWFGGLLGLMLLMFRPLTRIDAVQLSVAHRALSDFSVIGTLIVGTIVVTGVVNAWLLVGWGNLASLPGTLYGQLLLGKLVLFAAMIGLAALNRYRLTPRLNQSLLKGDHADALRALQVSLSIETTSAVIIMGIVAWLGTLAPLGGL